MDLATLDDDFVLVDDELGTTITSRPATPPDGVATPPFEEVLAIEANEVELAPPHAFRAVNAPVEDALTNIEVPAAAEEQQGPSLASALDRLVSPSTKGSFQMIDLVSQVHLGVLNLMLVGLLLFACPFFVAALGAFRSPAQPVVVAPPPSLRAGLHFSARGAPSPPPLATTLSLAEDLAEEAKFRETVRLAKATNSAVYPAVPEFVPATNSARPVYGVPSAASRWWPTPAVPYTVPHTPHLPTTYAIPEASSYTEDIASLSDVLIRWERADDPPGGIEIRIDPTPPAALTPRQQPPALFPTVTKAVAAKAVLQKALALSELLGLGGEQAVEVRRAPEMKMSFDHQPTTMAVVATVAAQPAQPAEPYTAVAALPRKATTLEAKAHDIEVERLEALLAAMASKDKALVLTDLPKTPAGTAPPTAPPSLLLDRHLSADLGAASPCAVSAQLLTLSKYALNGTMAGLPQPAPPARRRQHSAEQRNGTWSSTKLPATAAAAAAAPPSSSSAALAKPRAPETVLLLSRSRGAVLWSGTNSTCGGSTSIWSPTVTVNGAKAIGTTKAIGSLWGASERREAREGLARRQYLRARHLNLTSGASPPPIPRTVLLPPPAVSRDAAHEHGAWRRFLRARYLNMTAGASPPPVPGLLRKPSPPPPVAASLRERNLTLGDHTASNGRSLLVVVSPTVSAPQRPPNALSVALRAAQTWRDFHRRALHSRHNSNDASSWSLTNVVNGTLRRWPLALNLTTATDPTCGRQPCLPAPASASTKLLPPGWQPAGLLSWRGAATFRALVARNACLALAPTAPKKCSPEVKARVARNASAFLLAASKHGKFGSTEFWLTHTRTQRLKALFRAALQVKAITEGCASNRTKRQKPRRAANASVRRAKLLRRGHRSSPRVYLSNGVQVTALAKAVRDAAHEHGARRRFLRARYLNMTAGASPPPAPAADAPGSVCVSAVEYEALVKELAQLKSIKSILRAD